jgi:hypothetical protein
MNKAHLWGLVLALTCTGIGFFLYKWLALGYPLLPDVSSSHWVVEVRASFRANGGPAKLALYVPLAPYNYAIVDQQFVARGYGLSTRSSDGNRQAVFAVREARGEQVIYYRFVVFGAEVDHAQPTAPAPAAAEIDLSGPELAAATALVEQAREESADVATLVSTLLGRLVAREREPRSEVLARAGSSTAKVAALAAQTLALAGLPARSVHGLALSGTEGTTTVVHWIEVFLEERWQPYSLAAGEAGVPEHYMAWWRGDDELARVEGGKGLSADIAVRQIRESELDTMISVDQRQGSRLLAFSPLGLPLSTQQLYRVLLPVALGVFIIAVMRNMVGVTTIGTFMPVLVALAFRQTELVWGIILFTSIVAVGLMVRFYLEHLKLLVVPRLAAVLITVILLMLGLSVLSNRLGFHQGLSVGLFPMVIITMAIERMSVIWDERGAAEAFKQGAGSLAVAVACYAVMRLAVVEHLLFTFPELLLLILAATVLVGRYSGYRLVELRRFLVLSRAEQ